MYTKTSLYILVYIDFYRKFISPACNVKYTLMCNVKNIKNNLKI